MTDDDYDQQLHIDWLREAKRLAVEYRMADDGRECAAALRSLMAHLAGKPASMP